MVRPAGWTMAPRWAAVSVPLAPPLTTVNPAPASSDANRSACSRPYRLHLRLPTIATAFRSRGSIVPRTYSTSGGSGISRSSGG